MQPQLDLSVVLCTLNRAATLDRCFAHLATSGSQLQTPWELIVVDNGSTDATPDVIARWSERLPMRVVRENRRGLASARNAGVRTAAGRITAFVDDDCIVSEDWLASILAAHAPPGGADGVGGRVRLSDPADLPVSLRDFDDAVDIVDLQGIISRLIGCNFSARTDALRATGDFDERLGIGTAAMSAEDIDLFYRMLRAGLRLRFEPAIQVFHAHGRQSSDELRALARGYLLGRGACYAKYALRADRNVIKNAYWEMRGLVAAALPGSGSAACGTTVLSPMKALAALARGVLLRLTGG